MKTKLFLASALLFAASVTTAFAFVQENYYLVGPFNHWGSDDMTDYTFSSNDDEFTLTLDTFGGGGEEATMFKIKKGGQFLGVDNGTNYWLTKTNPSVALVEKQSNNEFDASCLYLQFPSSYTFTIKDDQLSVNLDDYVIVGISDNWSFFNRMNAESDGSYTYEINGQQQFKIRDYNGTFYGGEVKDNEPTHRINPEWHTNISLLENSGQNFEIVNQGTHTVVVKDGKLTVLGYSLTLSGVADNTSTLYNNQIFDVEIDNYTIISDGYFITICLPFTIPSVTGTIFEHFTIKYLESSTLTNGVLSLNFSSIAIGGSIEAGKPYIVKRPSDFGNINNPAFTGVTINSTVNPFTSDVIDFIGTYKPETISGNQYLYLGANNTLYYPNENVEIGAFHGYFKLADGYTAGDAANKIKAFVLNFDDETTSIQEISNLSNTSNTSNSYFTLDGRRINGQPATAGLYIINGKKVMIK